MTLADSIQSFRLRVLQEATRVFRVASTSVTSAGDAEAMVTPRGIP